MVDHLGGGVLGDSLGAFRDGVLGELTGEDETDRGLNFPGRDGATAVGADEVTGLGGKALEDIVDEGVHDGHGLLGDTGIGVDLLEDLEDVGAEGFLAAFAATSLLGALGGLAGDLLDGLLGWHDEFVSK